MSAYINKIGKVYALCSLILSIALSIGIFSVLLFFSWEAIAAQGWTLFSVVWHPATEQYGIFPMLFGSAVVTFIALILAVPVGLLTAVYIAEILAPKYRIACKSTLEILAGIPSIVYGLIGVAFLSSWVEHWFDLSSGRSLLTAGILLAVMILPMLITLADDGLQNVPEHYRESGRGLGLYRYEIIWYCVLPLAKPDIVSAILLALGRALGETMAVMLVIGSIDKIPQPVFNLLMPGQTVTSKLGREIQEAAFGSLHFSVLVFMCWLLLLTVLTLTLLARKALPTTGRRYE
jgi:phosphate ABC transporter permease protein PstC